MGLVLDDLHCRRRDLDDPVAGFARLNFPDGGKADVILAKWSSWSGVIARAEPEQLEGLSLPSPRTADLLLLEFAASDYLLPGAKHAAERAAFADLAAPAGDRALALFAEYEAATSREARFVHACDKLQLMLKVAVYESWGTGALAEFWTNPDNFPPPEFAPVDALLAALRARHAR